MTSAPTAAPGCLARQFERWRPHLTSVAYNMLGSLTEAEDAVQEAWFRLDRNHPEVIGDLRAWLTTVVGRISLDMLRARKARPVDPVGAWLPEPLVTEAPGAGPESQSMLADSVGLALLVVLESLTPAERLAFVLHDVFALPFDTIGRIVDRSPEAARQLASRARRRVRSAPQPDPSLGVQRRVVDAFLAAARDGNFAALLDLLDPEAVLRFDLGPDNPEILPTLFGAEAIARHIVRSAPRFISLARPVWVNGAAGALFGTREDPLSVLSFTVTGGRIAELGMVSDPAKLRHLADRRRRRNPYGVRMASKLAVVVRTDLDMGRGKIAAQVAHAAVAAVLRGIGSAYFDGWLRDGQPKVVLKVATGEGLRDLAARAGAAGLPVELIQDAGRTQVTPGTLTCCAIGPAPDGDIDAVTGELALL